MKIIPILIIASCMAICSCNKSEQKNQITQVQAPATAQATLPSNSIYQLDGKWIGKRLPTANEWEYMGLAERANRPKGDTMSLTTYILKWYERPMPTPLPSVGSTFKNTYGVWDAHGLIWEWVFDFNTAINGGDSRTNAEIDRNFSCAAGAGSTINKEDYASYMRYAFRQSLKANYTVGNLGFRCAKDVK